MNKRIKAILSIGKKTKYSEVQALRINQSQVLEIEKFVDCFPNRLVPIKELRRLLNSLGVSYSENESNSNEK
jgi:hypothetical protein